MRLGVITTFWGGTWGGSEALWVSMAHAALKEGHHVDACFVAAQPANPKFQSLRKNGARFFLAGPIVAGHIAERIGVAASRVAKAVRARLSQRNVLAKWIAVAATTGGNGLEYAGRSIRYKLSPLPAFFKAQPDIVFINEGGAVPADMIIDAVERHPEIPYVVLCHSNQGLPTDDKARRKGRGFLLRARTVLFVSEATLKATERQLLINFDNATVVRNPVNLDSLEAVPWPTDETLHFAAVGRHRLEWKGQDILLEALSEPQWQSRDWRLSFYGVGENTNYLVELAAFYGLSHRVTFAGQVDDIRSVWKTAHALVLPSRVEGAPLVVVEAMLCARPVIVTAVGGVAEWVQEPTNGFIAEAASVPSYSAALERAWAHRADWKGMGEAAHAYAIDRHEPASGTRLLSVLQQSLQRSQPHAIVSAMQPEQRTSTDLSCDPALKRRPKSGSLASNPLDL